MGQPGKAGFLTGFAGLEKRVWISEKRKQRIFVKFFARFSVFVCISI